MDIQFLAGGSRMKVGDLVRYPGFPQIGVVIKIEGPKGQRVRFVGTTGYETWTHIANLKVLSESR